MPAAKVLLAIPIPFALRAEFSLATRTPEPSRFEQHDFDDGTERVGADGVGGPWEPPTPLDGHEYIGVIVPSGHNWRQQSALIVLHRSRLLNIDTSSYERKHPLSNHYEELVKTGK